MRSGLLIALASTTACSGTPEVHVLPDSAARALKLDVVLANGHVTLYTNYSDLDATSCVGGDVFPTPGTNFWLDDTITCQPRNSNSCLTKVALNLGGTEVKAPIESGWEMSMAGDVAAAGSGQLLLEGCGGAATIDLPVATVTQPTLTASVDHTAGTITATWSATPSAASALIVMSTPLYGNVAHVTASPYTFDVGTGSAIDSYREVSVTTFTPPTVVTSPFGLVHIWTGGYTNVSLP